MCLWIHTLNIHRDKASLLLNCMGTGKGSQVQDIWGLSNLCSTGHNFLWPQHASQSLACSAKNILNVLLSFDPTAWPRKVPGVRVHLWLCVSRGSWTVLWKRAHPAITSTHASVWLPPRSTSGLAEETPGFSELGFPAAIPLSQTQNSCSSPGCLMAQSMQTSVHPWMWAQDPQVTAPRGCSDTSYRPNSSPCSAVLFR